MLCCLLASCVERSPTTGGGRAAGTGGRVLWPDLAGIDREGDYLPFSDPATKALVVIFVLPDCPICNSYIPEFNRLHQQFAPRGAPIVLVHIDPEITDQRARRHALEFQIGCPVTLDKYHLYADQAGATIAPEAAVFSPSGDLLYRGRIDDQYAGLGKRRTQVTSHDLRDALEAILADKPVPNPRTEAVGCPIPEISTGK
jgi:thiol-disulfide isomerase/thioredoxin